MGSLTSKDRFKRQKRKRESRKGGSSLKRRRLCETVTPVRGGDVLGRVSETKKARIESASPAPLTPQVLAFKTSAQPSILDDLPFDMICGITIRVDCTNLAAWLSTCWEIARISQYDWIWAERCRVLMPLVDSAMNPFFHHRQYPKLSWKMKYQYLRPMKLRRAKTGEFEAGEIEDVDESGLIHTNRGNIWSTVSSQSPFLTCLLGTPYSTEEMRQGVEYFEAFVAKNTLQYNRAVAIGITSSPMRRYSSFLGWERDTIAYHSDDGTIRNSTILAIRSKFSTGDIVGCGINWPSSEVFFTKNGKLIAAFARDLRKCVWYPVVGSMIDGDEMRINFGRQVFCYDFADLRDGTTLQDNKRP